VAGVATFFVPSGLSGYRTAVDGFGLRGAAEHFFRRRLSGSGVVLATSRPCLLAADREAAFGLLFLAAEAACHIGKRRGDVPARPRAGAGREHHFQRPCVPHLRRGGDPWDVKPCLSPGSTNFLVEFPLAANVVGLIPLWGVERPLTRTLHRESPAMNETRVPMSRGDPATLTHMG
jgi:hypothetical protein